MLLIAGALLSQTVDTVPAWDGSSAVASFGVPDTATYGQTLTVLGGAKSLTSFAFEIGNCSASVTFRGKVYAWDGAQATGSSLFDGAATSLPSGSTFQLVTFTTGGIMLPEGTYVLFASTSQDQSGAPSSGCQWGTVADSTYTGGSFVFQDTGTNTSLWTSAPWSAMAVDLAFQARFTVPTAQTVDTVPAWDGSSIASFGVPDTATYGQTFTVAAGAGSLTSFAFLIGNCSARVTFRGKVYAWDGTKATGSSRFDGAATSLPSGSAFQLVTFTTGGITLPAGTYVLFASTSQDQTGAPSSGCQWGSVADSTYTGGSFVFQDTGTNTSLWTSSAWSTMAMDLAFQANFGGPPAPTSTTVPDASPIALLLTVVGLAGLGLQSRYRGVERAKGTCLSYKSPAEHRQL